MSRRPPNPAAERAAQNSQTIKSLLKLEPNKVCADCKRNKHPRWASWNLGIFICIRCSGIHRGMGTHISRVKSVDLDSWTDEQLQSVLNWGNARANKYWESKLAANHAPSEAKIENFIRTKYELKRWAMDGPMPNPADLDVEGDDEVPLSIVKEKKTIERKVSLRNAPPAAESSTRRAPPQGDLIGGGDVPPRASTAGPSAQHQVPPKSSPAPPKTVTSNASLLGLDFLGDTPAAPPRPASTTGTASGGGQSRPDLKQSILSLYASAPRPQPPQQSGHQSTGSFGGGFGSMQSPLQSPSTGHQQGGGLNDAFASLSFGNPAQSQKSPQVDAFAGLTSMSSRSSNMSPVPSTNPTYSGLGGGSFFDSKPPQQQKPPAASNDPFSAFASPGASSKPAQSSSAGLGDFDWSMPAQPSIASPPAFKAAPAPSSNSVFNLSATPAPAQSTPAPAAAALTTSDADIWGGNAWGAPDPAPAAKSPAIVPKPAAMSAGDDFGGWGSSAGGSFASQSIVPGMSGGFAAAPKVAADEEFGGWTSSTGGNSGGGAAAKPAGGFGGGNDDLFNNVWE
ncbi:putative GTPase activating protein for Arf-domain-containing protein [Astrocystis sublimbata]|nr:putative GTPase activating protein for Arf-domain-containing protein [Astrocystis sublimbata]